MQVKVKKRVLFNLLKRTLNETPARSDLFQSNYMGSFADLEEDEPIVARPHTTMQLSVEEPPVADPEYVPGSLEELSLAASVMMREVPFNQIEFVYRFLHKLLDMALDKEEEEGENLLNESYDQFQKSKIAQAAKKVATEYADAQALANELIADGYFDDSTDDFELGQEIQDAADQLSNIASQPETQSVVQQPVPKRQSSPKTIIRRRSAGATEKQKDDLSEPSSERVLVTSPDEFMQGFYTAYKVFAKGYPPIKRTAAVAEAAFKGGEYEKGFNKGKEMKQTSDIPETPNISDPLYRVEQEYNKHHSEPIPAQFNPETAESPQDFINARDYQIERLVPVFYLVLKLISLEAEAEGFESMGKKDEKDVVKSMRAIYGIDYSTSFSRQGTLDKKFTKEKKHKTATSLLNDMRAGKFEKQFIDKFNFYFNEKMDFIGISEDELKKLLVDFLVERLEYSVQHYDDMPRGEALEYTILTNFTYLTANPKAADVDKRPYSQYNTSTFENRVQPDQVQTIATDLLGRIVEKYFSPKTGKFVVKQGALTHTYTQSEIENAAKDFIDKRMKKIFDDRAKGIVQTPDELEAEPIEDVDLDLTDDSVENFDEEAIDPWLPEEIASHFGNIGFAKGKQKEGTDYDEMASFTGYKDAAGVRQWILKWPKRFWKLTMQASGAGDRTLLDLHGRIVEDLIDQLPRDLAAVKADFGSAQVKDANKKMINPTSEQTQMFNHVVDQLQELSTKLDEGENILDATLTGMDGTAVDFRDSFARVFVTNFVSNVYKNTMLLLDRDWEKKIAEMLIQDPEVNVSNEKDGKSLAQYWTDKKNVPAIISTPEGDLSYKGDEKTGKLSKGGRVLMAAGITPEKYREMGVNASDWLDDVGLSGFARMKDSGTGKFFDAEYRTKIFKDIDSFNVDAEFADDGTVDLSNKQRKKSIALLSRAFQAIIDASEDYTGMKALENLENPELIRAKLEDPEFLRQLADDPGLLQRLGVPQEVIDSLGEE